MSDGKSDASGGWNVAYGGTARGRYAYRPHQVIVRGDHAVEAVHRLAAVEKHEWPDPDADGDGSFLVALPHSVDVPRLVADLADEGVRAEPNYVLFTHDCCCCGPHPAWRGWGYPWGAQLDPVHANPVHANPVHANPVHANDLDAAGVYASPLYADPVHANDYITNGTRKSSAVPATPPHITPSAPAGGVKIIILDTGLAKTAFLPPFLVSLDATTAIVDRDEPDENGDGELDPAAGHGTFIAGVIELLDAGRPMFLGHVMETTGDGDEWTIGTRLKSIVDNGINGNPVDERTIFNLSFGGYAPDEMWYLARQIRRAQALGAVVVASAGNDATCEPSYPAAFADVVGVGALGPNGPAWFTNYGPWVRASAPGMDLVSAFFVNFNGPVPPIGAVDPDLFAGWARWSGTSFSTPTVVAALAREMARTGCTSVEAVGSVIDDPLLLHIADLGTVVNIA